MGTFCTSPNSEEALPIRAARLWRHDPLLDNPVHKVVVLLFDLEVDVHWNG